MTDPYERTDRDRAPRSDPNAASFNEVMNGTKLPRGPNAAPTAMQPDGLVEYLANPPDGGNRYWGSEYSRVRASEVAAHITRLEADLREAHMQILASDGQAQEAYEAQTLLEVDVARLTKERNEAQADAYRSSFELIGRVAELDSANERANKNWRNFRDLRLAITGDGPVCRDCADFDGRCQGTGQPCDPDEAVKEQIASWKSAEAQNKAMREALERQRVNIEHWIETGKAASPEESKSIYDQICAALDQQGGGKPS